MSLIDALFLDPQPVDVFIAYRVDGVKGSGTRNDPWNGSRLGDFDKIMDGLPEDVPVRVHLGPSPWESGESPQPKPFLTRGFYLSGGVPGVAAWQPRPNMIITSRLGRPPPPMRGEEF